MKKIIIILLIVVGILYITRGKWQRVVAPTSNLTITTSFYPLYYFTSQLVGDRATVTNITPAGAEPHEYEPTPQDILTIEGSQLLIMNGKLEPWGAKIKENLANKSIKIVEVGTDLITRTVKDEEGETNPDPHIWLSPKLAKKIVDNLVVALTEIDPQDKATFAKNQAELLVKLTQLDLDYQNGLRTCKSRNIITSHAAFGYLAQDYGLAQTAINGLSPDAEPSLKELTQITKFARDNNVHYIFFESLVSPKLAETIAKEVGAKPLVLNPLEGLTEEEIMSGKEYLTVMRDNLQNLRTALECQ